MGRLDIIMDDGLEKKFRQEVAKRIGYKRGNIKAAIEEAVRDWLVKDKKGSDKH
jgi:hypothetical protein